MSANKPVTTLVIGLVIIQAALISAPACSPKIIATVAINHTVALPAPSPAASPTPLATSAELYIGMQANPNSRIYRYHLDYAAPNSSMVSYIANSGNLVSVAGNSIRSLVLLSSSDMIAGAWNSPISDLVSSDLAIKGALTFSGGGTNSASGVHSGCTLPNGNLIIGDDYESHTNNINEYTSNGVFIRSVYRPSQLVSVPNPYPGMTNCVAISNSGVIIAIADTWGIQNSKALQMTLSEGAWSVTHTFSVPQFDTLNGTTGSSIWTLALGRDGYVYFPPMQRAAGQIQKLIKCPASDITETNCQLVGEIIPESTLNSSNHTTLSYAFAHLPDTDDFLLALYYRLYRYNGSSGTYTLVHSFSDELPIDTFVPRAMVIRK